MAAGFGWADRVHELMTRPELADVGFALVLALMTIGIATLFGLWIKGDTQRHGRRRGRYTGRGAGHRH